jgi:hypothetical protein
MIYLTIHHASEQKGAFRMHGIIVILLNFRKLALVL